MHIHSLSHCLPPLFYSILNPQLSHPDIKLTRRACDWLVTHLVNMDMSFQAWKAQRNTNTGGNRTTMSDAQQDDDGNDHDHDHDRDRTGSTSVPAALNPFRDDPDESDLMGSIEADLLTDEERQEVRRLERNRRLCRCAWMVFPVVFGLAVVALAIALIVTGARK